MSAEPLNVTTCMCSTLLLPQMLINQRHQLPESQQQQVNALIMQVGSCVLQEYCANSLIAVATAA
jgi:hypothetical protein